ncbi:MAG: hypothetical protein GY768_10670, partial [Planctomycetaceae bacterium]|nr:hypothetical protein [Planctomycetaceae bacterium]
MRPGYQWSGEFLVWDLRDFRGVDLQRDASYKNIGFLSPHQSSRIELYGGRLSFPLKQRYDERNSTLMGVDPGGVSGRVSADAPGSTSATDFAPTVEEAKLEETHAKAEKVDEHGIGFDPGYGHYKLDKRGRRYPVDETGTRTFRFEGGRTTSRPEGVSGALWSQLSAKEKTHVLDPHTHGHLPGEVPPSVSEPVLGDDRPDLGGSGRSGQAAAAPSSLLFDLDQYLPKSVGDEPWDFWDRSITFGTDLSHLLKGRRGVPIPAMATRPFIPVHRQKDIVPLFNAAVARPVNRTEIASTPAAYLAMQEEWDRLRRKKVWDETVVREWADVAAEARRLGIEVHMGYLFGICVEKNCELPVGHPSRKFKGRVVFQGNRVKNQDYQAAIFQDLGSAPATMDAARAADCYGCAPGNTIEVADGEQAYIQADLRGTPCWISLPPDQRPASMKGFKN